MEKLIFALKSIPEYRMLLKSIDQGESAAITGIGQINRSHLICGLRKDISLPLILICQDDMAAKRLQEELRSFLDETVPVLPGRELTMYDSSVVSRGWEQKRLRQLWDLCAGRTPVQIFTWDALSLRTIPPQTLKQASFLLPVGREYTLDSMIT